MAKVLANLFLFVATIGVMLGNMWYTFGLWPQSWVSFFIFSFLGIMLIVLRFALEYEK